MLNKSTTMFHAALCGEIEDIRNGATSKIVDRTFADNEGCLAIPTKDFIGSSYRSNSFSGKITNSNFTTSSLSSKIESFTGDKDLLVQFIKDTIGAGEMTYYGIIATTENWRINPLHPVTAFMILHNQIVFPPSFTITVYSWVHNPSVDQSKAETLMAGISKVLSVLPTSGNISVTTSPSANLEHDIALITGGNFLDRSISFDESGERPDFAVVPVQYLARSIVYPFYGLITLKYNGNDYRSANLWDFFSGNISAQGSIDLDSTCTGDLSSSNFESLKVLNTLNDHSTYSSNNVPDHPEEFVWACQVLSNALLQQGKLNNSQVTNGS